MKTNLLFSAAILFCILSLFPAESPAQKSKRSVLPRVGAIKDTQDVGNHISGGCDFHYLQIVGEKEPGAFVFVSTADGLLAMMNLNGSDERLELVKTTLWYESSGTAFARHIYRAGKVLITVSFRQTDYTSEYAAKIVLRRGRAVRTIRAFIQGQCDTE